MPDDPPPWLDPIPPLREAVARVSKERTRKCSRPFCGEVRHFTGCGYDVVFQLPSNIHGYSKLDVGTRTAYLLPLRTDPEGAPHWREIVNVFATSIYLPEESNVIQHTRMTITKGVPWDLTIKTKLEPLI